jgi:hypothetical protein
MSEDPKSMNRQERVAFWRTHVEAQRGSGMNVATYCRREHISKSSFAYWRKKLADGEVQSEPPVIVPIPIPQPQPASGPLFVHAGGVRIEVRTGFCAATLERLLAVLQRAA